jgi:hypothetical protein
MWWWSIILRSGVRSLWSHAAIGETVITDCVLPFSAQQTILSLVIQGQRSLNVHLEHPTVSTSNQLRVMHRIHRISSKLCDFTQAATHRCWAWHSTVDCGRNLGLDILDRGPYSHSLTGCGHSAPLESFRKSIGIIISVYPGFKWI